MIDDTPDTLIPEMETAGAIVKNDRSSTPFRADLITGTGPRLESETRDLLRRRLKAASVFLALALLASYLRASFIAGAPPFRGFHLGVTLLAGLLSLVLFWAPQLNSFRLRLIELLLIGSITLWLAMQEYASSVALISRGSDELILLNLQQRFATFMFLIFFYGLFVPNRWQRALTVLLPITLTPFLVRGVLRIQYPQVDWLPDATQAGGAAFILLLALAASVFGTHVINSLRVEAFKARQLGQYRLIQKIGSGGMGEVWRASHKMLARPAAVKLIRPDMLGSGNREMADLVLHRFEREAQATAALTSPHSIALYDFGITEDGTFYYVMELLEGLDLARMVHRFGPVQPARTIELLRQAAEALADAHDRQLIHRDIKPANVFACRMGREYDFVKVLDFGLVKELGGDGDKGSQLTRMGTVTGTPAFMSPEQCLGRELDGRSDIYSLGCVGYWLLTGELVFDDGNPAAVLADHIRTKPCPPSQRIDRPVPQDLEALILRCLEKDPSLRPGTVEELIEELSSCRDAGQWTRRDAERWWNTHLGSAS